MAFSPDTLIQRLSDLAAASPPSRYVVAFSGGMDSTVLLHALATAASGENIPILAVYIRHDLQDDAAAWEFHCRETASALGVAFEAVSVDVPRDTGTGMEAAARGVRYDALRQFIGPGDWLLSAHHQNDQAETLLLNVLRGSGVDGLAGIGAKQSFAEGALVRPLLDVSRGELLDYAESAGIAWVEDPSNTDNRFDRNYLRNDVLPRMSARWPAAISRLSRSSALCSEASELIAELANIDLKTLGRPSRIDISKLTLLTDSRQRNVLRRAMRLCGLPSAPESRLRQILDELVPAREDAAPLVNWQGGEARRYRSFLYLQATLTGAILASPTVLSFSQPELDLGSGGRLSIAPAAKGGILRDALDRGLDVRFRSGGESVRPDGNSHTKKLKNLFQEKGVVPWMRDRIPLLYDGDKLVAVADLWVSDEYACRSNQSDDGVQSGRIVWSNPPELF
jgi:tRNA(Ile)-lysidine synthase